VHSLCRTLSWLSNLCLCYAKIAALPTQASGSPSSHGGTDAPSFGCSQDFAGAVAVSSAAAPATAAAPFPLTLQYDAGDVSVASGSSSYGSAAGTSSPSSRASRAATLREAPAASGVASGAAAIGRPAITSDVPLPVGTAAGRGRGALPLIPFMSLRYVRPLGAGAFGEVEERDWEGTPVAVKCNGLSAANRASLEKEIELYEKIRDNQHPGIVQVLGVCMDAPDHRVRIVMRLYVKGALEDLLKSSRQKKVCLCRLCIHVR
jgi:hypothetical protein